MSDDRVIVTTRDPQSGEEQTLRLPKDGYIVVCGERRHVAQEQVYANGTAIVTIKPLEAGS